MGTSESSLHWLSVHPTSHPHVAADLHQQIASAIRDGRLVAGERLPSVRALAAQLNVAPNTVAKAVRSLEQAGLVSTHGRKGTIVESTHRAMSEAQEAAWNLVHTCVGAGLTHNDARALVDAAWHRAHTSG